MSEETQWLSAPLAAGGGCPALHHRREDRLAGPSPFASLSQRLLALRLARCLGDAGQTPAVLERTDRRSLAAALAVLIFGTNVAAAEPPFGDLPGDIAKPRSSASVPADLPGSRSDPCALYSGITLFVPVRGAVAEVDPAAMVPTRGSDCAEPSAAVRLDTSPAALPADAASE